MEHVLIAVAAFVAAGVTFFTGFGLGTVLLPVFVAFLSTELAIAVVALIHLLNNALKLRILRGGVARRVFLRFGVPALLFAPLGALALQRLSEATPIATYRMLGSSFAVMPVDVVLALLLAILGIQQLLPRLSKIAFPDRYLPVGGAASGFLGGLAGLQGALRSAFLIRAGLGPQAFLATGVAVALVVDVGRIATYLAQGTLRFTPGSGWLAFTGIVAASVGTIAGSRLLGKVTMRGIEVVVGIGLVVVAVALGAGLL